MMQASVLEMQNQEVMHSLFCSKCGKLLAMDFHGTIRITCDECHTENHFSTERPVIQHLRIVKSTVVEEEAGAITPKEQNAPWEETRSNGKVVVLGESSCKTREIMASLEAAGVPRDKIELHLGYDEMKNLNVGIFQYNEKYSLLLVGPMPHKTTSNRDFSSLITRIEEEAGFPKVVKLQSNNQLKITKTNLKVTVGGLIHEGYLRY